jgi:hypothetical protein
VWSEGCVVHSVLAYQCITYLNNLCKIQGHLIRANLNNLPRFRGWGFADDQPSLSHSLVVQLSTMMRGEQLSSRSDESCEGDSGITRSYARKEGSETRLDHFNLAI